MSALTPGKVAGLNAVSDDRGVIAAVAMDQRGYLKQMFVRELGHDPSDAQMSEFKEVVARNLTRHCSSILLDVEYGLNATREINGKGLLLAYEKAGYSPDKPEKLPTATEGWSALRIKEAGASAVKILVFYNPFEKDWVNNQKKAWVERIGAECRAVDIPLFLEFLGYDVHGVGEGSAEYAKLKPEIVIRSIEEFTKERYGADVLKLEVPIQMSYVEGASCCKSDPVYTRDEAIRLFHKAADATDLPIVYLSAGVTSSVFKETLEMAADNGVAFHGILGGRAIWQDGVPIYVKSGVEALEEWMRTTGAQNVEDVKKVLQKARSWKEARSMQGRV